MKIFKSKKQAAKAEEVAEECPKKSNAVDVAKKISEQYIQLSKCCEIISEASAKCQSEYGRMYSGGWKVSGYLLDSAGLDIEEVYAHIIRLAHKRKAEIECELAKLG